MSLPAENLPVASSHYTYSKNPRPLSQPPGLRPLFRDPICAVRGPSSDVPSWIPWRSITPGRFPSSSHGGGGGLPSKGLFPPISAWASHSFLQRFITRQRLWLPLAILHWSSASPTPRSSPPGSSPYSQGTEQVLGKHWWVNARALLSLKKRVQVSPCSSSINQVPRFTKSVLN